MIIISDYRHKKKKKSDKGTKMAVEKQTTEGANFSQFVLGA